MKNLCVRTNNFISRKAAKIAKKRMNHETHEKHEKEHSQAALAGDGET